MDFLIKNRAHTQNTSTVSVGSGVQAYSCWKIFCRRLHTNKQLGTQVVSGLLKLLDRANKWQPKRNKRPPPTAITEHVLVVLHQFTYSDTGRLHVCGWTCTDVDRSVIQLNRTFLFDISACWITFIILFTYKLYLRLATRGLCHLNFCLVTFAASDSESFCPWLRIYLFAWRVLGLCTHTCHLLCMARWMALMNILIVHANAVKEGEISSLGFIDHFLGSSKRLACVRIECQFIHHVFEQSISLACLSK